MGLAITARADARIPIGVSVSLTGPAAPWGADVRDGIEFANKRFGREKYKLIVEDDACSAKEGVSIAQKFVSRDKVKFVLGYNCSSVLLAAAPIYRANGVMVIASGATAKSADDGSYLFRTWPRDELAASLLARWAGNKFQSIGVLSEQADYAQQFEAAFRQTANANTIKLVVASFLPGATDFRTQLLRMKVQGVTAILINPVSEIAFIQILKQLRVIDNKMPVLGAFFPGSSTFMKLGDGLTDGVIYVDVPNSSDILAAEGRSIMAEYRKDYGAVRSWEFIVGSAIESFRTLDRVIQTPNPRDLLLSTKFSGIYGPYTYGKDGYVQEVYHSLYRYVGKSRVAVAPE